jgi:hypothetical protein
MLLVEIVLFYLVGGLEHEVYYFPYIGNFIIPTDELIFFRGVGIPPTSNMFAGQSVLFLYFGWSIPHFSGHHRPSL